MGTPRTYRSHDGIFTTFLKCTKRGLLRNHRPPDMRTETVPSEFHHLNGDATPKNHKQDGKDSSPGKNGRKTESEELPEDNSSVIKRLEEREREVMRLKEELERQELELNNQKDQYSDALKDLSLATKAKNNMCIQLVEQEKRVARLEQCLSLPVATRLQQRQELQVVREAIDSLRLCFTSNDPHQHTLDTIEQSIATLCERVNAIETFKCDTSSIPPIDEASGFSSPAEQSFSESTWHQPVPQLRATNPSYYRSHRESKHPTKVLYFMSRSTTPFQCTIHKRLNEITLRDFKTLFDRPGQYRFHFKTLDPIYGAVKEEIVQDDDVLPSWDGKIIAWVEEENG